MRKKIPKRNAFYIVGPPSSGKNFFIDMVCAFYLNTGNMGNFNRTNQFPFNDCENRRIILWNEINFAPSNIDTLKMLTGGDLMHVNIKFKPPQPIYRTPVLILSNKEELHDSAFNDRVYQYHWNYAPFLKDYDKKPHPLAYAHILKKYKIVDF